MRALAVCQDELVIRTLHRVLAGAFDVEFLVESRPLARRLVEDGVSVTVADPKRMDSWVRADLTPTTCVILEDNGRRSLKRIVTAVRESPTVAKHLHVPLQSGDDRVLAEMRRRYTVATYLRRLEPLRDVANLTADVIVGFPGEDEAAFARTLRAVDDAGITKVHVFPYSPRPGTRTAAVDPVPAAVKKERAARLRARSDDACRRRWASKLGTEDTVLVDRPGRGYGDDYTPWLVDAPVGSLVRVRAGEVTEEGVRAA